ncbi:MAG TPA: acylphosphatase [Stellaceae bacterium]|jgi:acylphosphatase|nr:acylphosphatase [Stellaceae bacterium]
MKTVRLRVSGRVQGVGYRAWAIEAAKSLGLRGWVRNRSDGSVELLATGPTESVAAMVEACWYGPPAARVDRVELVEAPDDDSAGFAARPDL